MRWADLASPQSRKRLRNLQPAYRVKNKWVINASPLILLAKVGQTDLLAKLTTELIVPDQVAREIMAGPVEDPSVDWLEGPGAGFIVPSAPSTASIAAWDLGAGESSVLDWALANHDFEAILDDRAARKCAAVHSMQVRGTLGGILAARHHEFIPAAKPVIEELLRAGLHVDRELIANALRLVNETA